MKKGLTLLEIMLAIGLMMIVATTLVPIFVGYLRRSELEDHSKQLLGVLQRAQRFSQTYEGGDTWIVELRNTTTTDYFLMYPSNTASQVETFYLPSHIVFTDETVLLYSPTSSLYITFEKFTGKGSYATTTPPIFENSTKTIDLVLINRPDKPITIEVANEGRIARFPSIKQVFQEGCANCDVSSAVPDNMLNQGFPTMNYGENLFLFLNRGATSVTQRPILMFDTANNIPVGSTVRSAILRFYVYNSSQSPDPGVTSPFNEAVLACKVTKPDWVERVLESGTTYVSNWNNYKPFAPWSTAGGDYTTSSPNCGLGITPSSIDNWIDIDVASVVQDAVTNNIDTHFLVRFQTESTSDTYDRLYLRPSEYLTDITKRPKLTVEYLQ